MRRKVALLLTAMVAALVAASGVALARDVTCEPGNSFFDPCQGTTGDDLITGTTGGDYITALEGVDTVNARGGGDEVFGGGARDTLEGAGGADFLCGGTGNDRLNGGTGPDEYLFGPGWRKDTIVGEETDPPPSSFADRGDYLHFGGNNCVDTLRVPLTIDLAKGVAFETEAGPTGANTVSFTAPQIENVIAGIEDDTIKGNRSPNYILANGGNDTINVRGGGNDYVDCGEGEQDTVIVNVEGGDETSECEIVDDTIGFSAVGDFSATLNPSGAWSYGYRTLSGSGLTLYTELDNPAVGLERWSQEGAPTEPMVAYNNTGQPLTWSSVVHPPDLLNVHPGPSGEKSVVRWTAPTSGTVKIKGRFEGIDNFGTTTEGDGTTTDVTVVKNSNTGTPLFGERKINAYDDEARFEMTETVAAGSTIDFVVGYGSNATHANDSTGLSVTITPT